jgi:membrane-associated phospholipid phosphatase
MRFKPMPTILKVTLLLVLQLLLLFPVIAQQTALLPDTAAHAPISKNKPKKEGQFPWKGLIIPTILVGYGFAAVSSQALQDFNQHIQDQVWTNNPHDQIHLDDYLRFVPAVAVYGLNIAGVKGKNNFRDRTMILAMSSILMGGTVYTLKHTIQEPLPPEPHDIGYNSFPSGHTAEAFMSAEFLREEYAGKSAWYGVAGYACAIATGYLRLYNNQHWFSDVVAGAGIGIGSVKLSYWLYPKIRRALFKDKPVSTLILPTYQNNTIGLCLVKKL